MGILEELDYVPRKINSFQFIDTIKFRSIDNLNLDSPDCLVLFSDSPGYRLKEEMIG